MHSHGGAPFVVSMLRDLLTNMTLRLFFAWLFSLNVAVAAVEQDELDQLVANGATELALSLLQESAPTDPVQWWWLLQQKLGVYQRQQRWDAILEDVENASTFELEIADRQWLNTQAAIAYLGKGDGIAARDLLMPLLWGEEKNSSLFRQWRELVVRSYLVDGRYDDAKSAVIRYEQDYADAIQSTEWLLLKAHWLIFSGYGDEALMLLSESGVEKGNPIFLLAQLRSGAEVPIEVLLVGVEALEQQRLSAEIAEALYDELLKADERLVSLDDRVLLLEHLLARAAVDDVDINPTADLLWQAYEALALEIANEQQLLIGSFEPWVVAIETLTENEPLKARALDAWLALQTDGELARQAHERFGANLDEAYGSFELIAALYLASDHFATGEGVPVTIRYRLLDNALTQGNEAVATAMMNSLPRPAGIKALVDWQLRRARVQVLAGTAEYGAKLLEQLTKSGYDFDRAQLGAYLQVFYDLQASGRRELAYKVADAVLPQLAHQQPLQQQLLEWLAGQDEQAEAYELAARRYIQLAALAENDDVVQQARLSAAQALHSAGLVSDAIHLYRRALMAGTAAAQRKMILQIVKRLRALERASGS